MKPKDAVIKIDKIDFRQLRMQKLDLIYAIAEGKLTTKQAGSLEGILCLIDAIQDYAVESEQLTHYQVFGKNYGIPGGREE
jgi:hypothetical protein